MINMYKLIIVCVIVVLCMHCEARLFTRCGLVHELRKQGFPAYQLSNWVCLIEAESARNTRMVRASYNSRDWGLFQINDKYWCSTTSTPGKDCNAKCRDLVKDDITEASKCAKIIYARYNFDRWFGWTRKCKDKQLPDISKCNHKQ